MPRKIKEMACPHCGSTVIRAMFLQPFAQYVTQWNRDGTIAVARSPEPSDIRGERSILFPFYPVQPADPPFCCGMCHQKFDQPVRHTQAVADAHQLWRVQHGV